MFRDIVVYFVPNQTRTVVPQSLKLSAYGRRSDFEKRSARKRYGMETHFTSPSLPFPSGVGVVAASDDAETQSKVIEEEAR